MKKVLFLVLSILVFIGVVASSFYVGDRTSPEIEIKQTPRLTCDCEFKDLIDFAKASDDNLKSFFIENSDIEDVINTRNITYVAIDNSNNVTKLKTNVEIDKEYTDYHIETIKELKIQKGTEFNINDYFEVENACGLKVYDRLKITDFSTNKIGDTEVEVTSTINVTEPLTTNIEVFDEFAPKISLSKDEINYFTNTRWSDRDFLNIIETLEDDKDQEEYLIENMDINWRSVMHADASGLVINPGHYEVTYTVIDSDGNVTKTSVNVNLENQQVQEVIE